MTRPKNTVTFAQASAQLQSGAALKPTWLRGFNNLSEDDLAAFHTQWDGLSSARRIALTTALLDLAANDIELSFNPIFRLALNDPEADVRRNAVNGLGEEENVGLIDPTLELLKNDPSEQVRAAAAGALGRFALLAELDRLSKDRRTQIYKTLLATFRAAPEDSPIYRRALESLGFMANDTIAMYIRAAFASEEADTRRSALIAMGRSQDQRFCEFVREELNALQPANRLAAVEATGELEDETAVPELKTLFDDSDRQVQMAALNALAQIGGKESREVLQQAVLSPDEAFAKTATDALAMYDFWHGEIDFSLTNFDEDDLKPRRVWKRSDTTASVEDAAQEPAPPEET